MATRDRTPGSAGGFVLVTREILKPGYKPDVYRDSAQRLAFLRLVGLARWSDNGAAKRGQIRASLRELVEMTGLPQSTLRGFLRRLEADGAVSWARSSGRGRGLLTLLNYGAWQDVLAHDSPRGCAENGTSPHKPAHFSAHFSAHDSPHGDSENPDSPHTPPHIPPHTIENEGNNEGEGVTEVTPVGDGAPTAKKRKRKSKPKTTAGRPGWVTEAGERWKEAFGGEPSWGRLGKALKPVVAAYGETEVLKQWVLYLAAMGKAGRVAFATPEDFASRYGYYREHGVRQPSRAQEDYDRRHPTTAKRTYTTGDTGRKR